MDRAVLPDAVAVANLDMAFGFRIKGKILRISPENCAMPHRVLPPHRNPAEQNCMRLNRASLTNLCRAVDHCVGSHFNGGMKLRLRVNLSSGMNHAECRRAV